jgi:transcriptional regulator GlxA family with amidase domain
MTIQNTSAPVKVAIIAVEETAGSALYGMKDVLMAAGAIWQTLVWEETVQALFEVKIVSVKSDLFSCGNGIPVAPDCSIEGDEIFDIVILPELWLGPEEHLIGRYPALVEWVKTQFRAGAFAYSACSGSIMLAETGLLDNKEATSHWGYQYLFDKFYPQIRFKPDPNICFADPSCRVVTSGGTTSWHDLALYIISKHGSPGEAMRISKVYLLKWHGESELAYQSLINNTPHADSVVRECQEWLKEHFTEKNLVGRVVEITNVPERTLKRRFKKSLGSSITDYIQGIRIEEAKRLLEAENSSVDDIACEVGYEDVSFFRKLFKRKTGLTPAKYRKMFKPTFDAVMQQH